MHCHTSHPMSPRLVITDDIKMKGLGMSVWNATVASVAAGADLVLTSRQPCLADSTSRRRDWCKVEACYGGVAECF